jgi:hypothetical protein
MTGVEEREREAKGKDRRRWREEEETKSESCLQTVTSSLETLSFWKNKIG